MDLNEISEYFKQTIRQETITSVNYLSRSSAKLSLQMTEVDMVNDLFNPFPSSAGQFFFLDTDITSLSEHNSVWLETDEEYKKVVASGEIKVLDFSLTVKLGTMIQILERTRYNFWDLLGDVGGFNDGLHLVGSLLMSSYAAFSFKQSILKNVKVDVEAFKKDKKTASFENSAHF